MKKEDSDQPRKLRVSYEDENTKDAQEKSPFIARAKVSSTRLIRLSGLFKNLADISKINFIASCPASRRATSLGSRSSLLPDRLSSLLDLPPFQITVEEERFPVNVTTLMNEDNLWGSFYIFPELYEDEFSPTVIIRTPEELGDSIVKDGILTKDLIATNLSYLSRSPITGDYVYIKLDLTLRHLKDISALESYRFLQYLDLSRNLLTDLKVLTNLPYLQYLSAAFNNLSEVLDYKTPQWFLTEVHYRYNYVKKIRDLAPFWSITVLDLSHNNIKAISGLQELRYLRKLDLSFNHIQRLEHISHLRLTWLDVSYNNISSFESGLHLGLRTLLHLEYLDLNENQLTSLKVFSGCATLRELHTRNNRLNHLLELAFYMRNLRNLSILDLRENPVCSHRSYHTVVLTTMPNLLRLDDEYVDPTEQATVKLQMSPDVMSHATRRLLRLLYVEQLSRSGLPLDLPPADTTEVPIVVLVGPEACGKGSLCRRLAEECSDHVRHAVLHTTAEHHYPEHYRRVSREDMDALLVAGQLLTYSEKDGESYGLSRAEAFVSEGRVAVTSMGHLPALMLRLRHRRPYLILVTSSDHNALAARQATRAACYRGAAKPQYEFSNLQVLVSERIDVTGFLHEIITSLPDEKWRTSFFMASDCSLKVEKFQVMRQDSTTTVKEGNVVEILPPETYSGHQKEMTQAVPSLYSLYKSMGTNDFSAEVHWQPSSVEFSVNRKVMENDESEALAGTLETAQNQSNEFEKRMSADKPKRYSSEISRPKSADASRYTTSTWKGPCPAIPESTKSVTFLSREYETTSLAHLGRLTGLLLETTPSSAKELLGQSISRKLPPLDHCKTPTYNSLGCDDRDLWCSLTHDLGLLQPADELYRSTEFLHKDSAGSTWEERHFQLMMQSILRRSESYVFKNLGSSIKDDCECFNRKCPGIFWDTLNMDEPEEAFIKLKRVVKDIVNSQSLLKPMFDIDSRRSDNPVVRSRLERIQKEITPTRLFR